ncbi:hypothetical protein BWQ93_03320 [Sphingopyxis sp. QXT-31]|uniref:cysteine desulfurase family protein n=1 Tax=Sphingopyxis sp. QXT-31 TaxID=1357916 RepID=UPI0009792FA0|nr:cysteine desulfurase family protein [Sphingopyxis sp. QXT-31]APZ97624.1 hypothetical protein BWQ93_03320 [Sphingopyxis sp. QXT-31]
MTRPLYLDFQATTPVDQGVLAAMLPYFSDDFGNPHASEHQYGQSAAQAIAKARADVAKLIGARSSEIIFTSGATEANNLLLKSAAHMMADRGRRRIVSAATEHKAVIEVLARLGKQGFEVVWADVGSDGLVSIANLDKLVDEATALVTIMAVNNEIGVIQDLATIGHICRERGAIFHSDAAQAAGKIPLDVGHAAIDLMSLSAHKFYGPKGIGAAYIRRSLQRDLAPQIDGGGQEAGLRAGTLPTPLCVGIGAASALAAATMAGERTHLLCLQEAFLEELSARGAKFAVNGTLDRRWPGNLNLSFEGVDAEALVMAVSDRIAISSGSACTAEALEPSHVLRALGFGAERTEGAVRIGFGRSTTLDEVNRAARVLADSATGLAQISRSAEWKDEGVYGNAAE